MRSLIVTITRIRALGISLRDGVVVAAKTKRMSSHFARSLHVWHRWVQTANYWAYVVRLAMAAVWQAIEAFELMCSGSRLQPCRQPAGDPMGSLGSERRV
jgi:hypothetical protein